MVAYYSRRTVHRMWSVCGGLRPQIARDGGGDCCPCLSRHLRKRGALHLSLSGRCDPMRSKWPGSRFREIERLAAGVMQMNRLHRWYCRSSRWKRTLDNNILPWALSGIQLGEQVLEVGPGPGLTTDWLR